MIFKLRRWKREKPPPFCAYYYYYYFPFSRRFREKSGIICSVFRPGENPIVGSEVGDPVDAFFPSLAFLEGEKAWEIAGGSI